jgi:hypothetical protein
MDTTERLWQCCDLYSCEAFRADPDEAGGRRFRGDVVLLRGERPSHVSYRVDLDADWRTRRVEVDVDQATERTSFHLAADGQGTWWVDDVLAPELAGCLDVDLGWTPSTNTLPIRRLGLAVGEQRDIRAAWLRFPELTLEAATQTYRRLDETTWRYASGDFSADLLVDDQGYVRRYGDDLWRTPTSG